MSLNPGTDLNNSAQQLVLHHPLTMVEAGSNLHEELDGLCDSIAARLPFAGLRFEMETPAIVYACGNATENEQTFELTGSKAQRAYVTVYFEDALSESSARWLECWLIAHLPRAPLERP